MVTKVQVTKSVTSQKHICRMLTEAMVVGKVTAKQSTLQDG